MRRPSQARASSGSSAGSSRGAGGDCNNDCQQIGDLARYQRLIDWANHAEKQKQNAAASACQQAEIAANYQRLQTPNSLG